MILYSIVASLNLDIFTLQTFSGFLGEGTVTVLGETSGLAAFGGAMIAGTKAGKRRFADFRMAKRNEPDQSGKSSQAENPSPVTTGLDIAINGIKPMQTDFHYTREDSQAPVLNRFQDLRSYVSVV